MTTSPEEASTQTPVEPDAEAEARAKAAAFVLEQRIKAKQEITGRLQEVRTQVLAITPAKVFYGKEKGNNTYTYGPEHLRDIAADVQRAIEAVERL